ncbi:MAG: UDP-N-acetylmuramyl-tripeptide synthetase [Clostridia bacterium]|nr:UDP-N-acetylmuramyl-tripeptide synthetase [Clostridia bacterium]
MLLSEILKRIDFEECINFSERDILGVSESSRLCKESDIFVCIKGSRYDAASFIPEVIALGVKVIVVDKKTDNITKETTIICKNPRKTLAEISSAIYGENLKNMKIVGITGTKGKTTTAKMLFEILGATIGKSIFIGTLGVEYKGVPKESFITDNTTPSAPVLYKLLREAYELGVRCAVIEVSSQALKDFRVYKIPFSVCVFTNFSPDHIGEYEHKNLGEYLDAKRRLFCDYGDVTAVVNSDDEMAEYITKGVKRKISVGTRNCDYRLEIFNSEKDSLKFALGSVPFQISCGGDFNAKNAALAIAAAKEITGKKTESFRDALKSVKVNGRYETYESEGKRIIIDFAHNAESFKSILKNVRRETRGRILCLFGAVGGRSFSRRKSLAAAAEALADLLIITSDNPDFESPVEICDEIYSYVSDKSRAVVIPDRKEAIIFGYESLTSGDTLLLLGKGHEKFQYIRGEKVAFSEREIVKSLIHKSKEKEAVTD